MAITLQAGAIERFVSLSGAHIPPFTNWSDAATNIQEAIDASAAGDHIWVTNGVYVTGGKVMAGTLTNRIAIDKPITVQSVNGYASTIIKGVGGSTGPLAVRCAWLTNGAALVGFTLQDGATRSVGDDSTQRSGGGAWCVSAEAILANCMIKSNLAISSGGGVFQGTLKNCFLVGNSAQFGGGSYNGILNSCTVVSNTGFGTVRGNLTNCIVYYNTGIITGVSNTFSFCCTTPLLGGVGNITGPPKFLSDGFHLANGSPCQATGGDSVSGTDIDGQTWENPPSIGCDQWQSAPSIFIKPVQLTKDPVGFSIFSEVTGQEPITYSWLRDGVLIENDGHYNSLNTNVLIANGITVFDPGSYQIIASNSFGAMTSSPVQLKAYLVDASGTNPVAPYSNWSTAATRIQDAIDAALPGELVLVTNGIYSDGGKTMGGDLLNRAAIDKELVVASVNGPKVTTIQGAWSTTTNGLDSVRCVWITNGATLTGFTIRGGSTRRTASSSSEQRNGGGVFGSSPNAFLFNCIIATNAASDEGGGAYRVTLSNCVIVGNIALGSGVPGSFSSAGSGSGGGAAGSILKNCIVTGNSANNHGGGTLNCSLVNCALTGNSSYLYGAGAYFGTLLNCTVTGNISGGYGAQGAAVSDSSLTNCIVVNNLARSSGLVGTNYYNSTARYSCLFPAAPGDGNIAVDPHLLGDGIHISASSPCRGAGTNILNGTDLDGQTWLNPASIGADEWHPEALAFQQPKFEFQSSPTRRLIFKGLAIGQDPFAFSWLKDGVLLEEGFTYNSTDSVNLAVVNFGPSEAGNYQLIVSNGFGMSTSAPVRVVIHCADASSSSPMPPFSNWGTAAATIQDAIDIAEEGDIILVTNGVYSTGGKVIAGDLTNRVALTKALTVVSVNGPTTSVIQGAWDANTNGPLAVRCAWLTNGAVLSGFTLKGGATRSTGGSTVQSGGGVWAVSSDALVVNCFIFTNAASSVGGGSYQAALNRCKVVGNRSFSHGGGVAFGVLRNTFVAKNFAVGNGGGVYGGDMTNCTVVDNIGSFTGGWYGLGINLPPRNSIIVGNNWLTPTSAADYFYSGFGGLPSYCCIYRSNGTPFGGTGNINADPQFTDDLHLAVTSPCRGTGSALYASDTDFDGELWLGSPSIGCDEVIESAINGPLSVSASAQWNEVPERQFMFLIGTIEGRATRTEWSFGDGSATPPNMSSLIPAHLWTNAGNYKATFTAYNVDHTNGVSADVMVHVVPLISPTISSIALNGTNFFISFSGQSNVSYRVERATNLTPPIVWQTVASPYSVSNLIEVIDTKATNTAQYYRVRIP